MSRIEDWITERRRIHSAATPEMHQGRELRGFEDPLDVYSSREPNRTSTDVARFIFAEDATAVVDGHSALPRALTAIEKVLEQTEFMKTDAETLSLKSQDRAYESLLDYAHTLRDVIEEVINE